MKRINGVCKRMLSPNSLVLETLAKAFPGRAQLTKLTRGSQQKYKQQESAEIAKIKEQSAHKDAQLSALAGQLKKAGVTPDFSSV